LLIPIDAPISIEAGQSVRIDFSYQAGESLQALSESIHINTNSASKKHLRISA